MHLLSDSDEREHATIELCDDLVEERCGALVLLKTVHTKAIAVVGVAKRVLTHAHKQQPPPDGEGVRPSPHPPPALLEPYAHQPLRFERGLLLLRE